MHFECPTCKTVLNQHLVGGQQVDQCDNCKGTWYDESELSSILRSMGNQLSPPPPKIPPPSAITCPKCNIEIAATIYANDSGIPICKCANCKGTWLIEGQLEEIAVFRTGPHRTDGLAQAMADSYTKSARFKNYADLPRSRLLSLVFAAIIFLVAFFSKDLEGSMRLTRFSARGGLEGSIRLLPLLIFSLACIWFSDQLGNVIGIRTGLARPAISQATPGIAVAVGGWILMFAILGVQVYRAFAQ